MWKITSNFPKRKGFWYVKDMNIPSERMPGYKHGGVQNIVYMRLQWLNMAKLATIVYVVESGFIIQIKRKINILTEFEIPYLIS